MALLFVTAATKHYRPALIFHSLRKLSGRVVCLLEPGDYQLLPVNCQRLEYPVKGGLHQTGRFVSALPGVMDDDVVVLVDADGIFQRDLSPLERGLLLEMGDHVVAMGHNSRIGQKGWEEYSLLNPKVRGYEAAGRLGLKHRSLTDCRVYNTGFMVAEAKVWRALADWMASVLEGRNPAECFERPGWIQLLICAVLHEKQKIGVMELPYSTHSNGHFALTQKHHIVGRRLYYDDQLVLFAHNVAGVADLP